MDQPQWAPSEFLEKTLNVIPGVLYVFNQVSQSNEYASRSLTDMLGYSVEEAQAMGEAIMPTLCHPDDFPKVLKHFEAIQRLKDGEVVTLEYRMKHKEGHWLWLLSHDSVFDRNEDGSVRRHIGKAEDITTLKQNELRAQTEREEFETIFNAASSGIIALDLNGRIVRINNFARHLLGGISDPVPFDWPKAISFLEAESMSPLEASADPVRRALSGHSLHGETHLLRRVRGEESQRYVRVSNATVENDLTDVHVVLVIDDVSDEERNRQVVERKSRLDALGQLTGGIAHDFNNLLASLLYAVDLAERSETKERRDKYFQTAGTAIQQGRALTGRLLAFARRQPGLASARKTRDAFEDFSVLIRPMLEAQIEINFYVAEEGLAHFCDQAQLETALMNLVLNARDAVLRSGKGNRIEIRARPVRATREGLDQHQQGGSPDPSEAESFRYVEISVADNGPGMEAETLARCTDPFFTTKDTNSGTGLGLAMVYGFVRQSDGDLRVYSEEGIGTTVQMTLPRGSDQGLREPALPADEVQQGRGETLLVAEDEPQLLMMITDTLESMGYNVVTARSGQEALQLVENGLDFDLLLTDVVMPGNFGGFELARRVRALRAEMPVIYTSGYTGFTASEMGEVQAPLLQKPSPPAELAEAIANALAGE